MKHTITSADINVALNQLIVIAFNSDSKKGRRKKLEYSILLKEFKFSRIGYSSKYTDDRKEAIKWYNEVE